MASFSSVTAGVSTASATDINQFVDAFSGTGNYPVSVTGVNDTVSYAMSVRNQGDNNLALRVLDSSGTVVLRVSGGGAFVGKITQGSDATGDVYYRDSNGNFTRLALGSSGQALESTGGVPAWRTRDGIDYPTMQALLG